MKFYQLYTILENIDITKERWQKYLKDNKLLKSGVEVLDKLTKNNHEAYIVGGAVRDIILGHKPHDIDIATNMSLDKIEKIFPSHDIGKSKNFGIITIKHNNEDFEVANFRTDGEYTNGRSPDSVKIVLDFKTDASRRDLTINAMGIDKDGNIIDYFDGKKDIKNKLIRTVGNPNDRFKEDKLRMMRVARFSSKLGFGIDSKTTAAMSKHSKDITQISPERIRDELLKTAEYGGSKFADMIETLEKTGILKYILPEIVKMKEFKHAKEHHPEGNVWKHTLNALRKSNLNSAVTNLSILLHDVGKIKTLSMKDNIPQYLKHAKEGIEIIDNISDRLKLTNEQRNAIKFSSLNHMKFHEIIKMSNSKIIKLLNDKNFNVLLDVAKADQQARDHLWNPEEWQKIITKINTVRENMKPDEYEKVRKLINGKKIMDMLNLKPGKQVGEIINKSLEYALDNNIKNADTIYKYIQKEFS